MKRLRSKKTALIALVAVAMVFALNGPSEARGGGGHGFSGGHPGGGFEHHFGGGHFDGDHFHSRRHGRFVIGPAYPYYGYDYAPAYPYESPMSWWYCPSYTAYYPDVTSCPEAWVPVPAS